MDAQKRYAGVLVPIFSLRTKEGLGIGEFLDLIPLVDWMSAADLSLVQLLPFYDTTTTKTWLDSYCYSAISLCALHPLYLRVEQAFPSMPDELKQGMLEHKRVLNALLEVDYEEVYKIKFSLYKKIFSEEEKKLFTTPQWEQFFASNRHWLLPYAAFSALRDHFGTSDVAKWQEYGVGSQEVLEKVCAESSAFYADVSLYYFLQFHLHKQFLEARIYAQKKGISFKGDFAVGVHRQSAEAWAHPDLFVMGKNIGAPPDYFSLAGQNWQLPAYDWKSMQKQHYDWFVRRLKHAEQYCDLIRIDHILGYFRFWEIPHQYTKGALGHFNPSYSLSLQELPQDVREDLPRYTEPFITQAILEEVFGEKTERIKNLFLEKITEERYQFSKEYQEEKSIDISGEISEIEKKHLHDLYANRLLVQERGSFYPRIGLERTRSFACLASDKQVACKAWYNIYESPQEEALWETTAIERLRSFKNGTTMEICAEDLGMTPKCTKKVLEELGLLSLYVQRFPKKEGEEFCSTSDYEYASVCSPSNHDTSSLRLWWEEDHSRSERFYRGQLQLEGDVPTELSEDICKQIIRLHLVSPSKWAVFLLQDLLAMDSQLKSPNVRKERINDPAVYPFYWRWRLHIPIEQLLQEEKFTQTVKSLVQESGRIKLNLCKDG